MTGQAPISYSDIAKNGQSSEDSNRSNDIPRQNVIKIKRSPSPAHRPRTSTSDEDLFVLTMLTDKAHHARMTKLRDKYFPRRLNKLEAHLTLFHALPGSVLQDRILPTIDAVSKQTRQFQVRAERVFRLKKGIAISLANDEGSRAGHRIHQELQSSWQADGFLSEQDAGGCRLHYTIMNKVDEEEKIADAFKEVSTSWHGDTGTATGLALWRYDRGFWRSEQRFMFQAA